MKTWMEERSSSWSELCDDNVTHGEVIATLAVIVSFFAVAALLNWISTIVL